MPKSRVRKDRKKPTYTQVIIEAPLKKNGNPNPRVGKQVTIVHRREIK